jgi:uncharacterized tellurite resistance protein B-like protein
VPAGERAAIAGYDVGGMIYAGTGLPPVSRQRVGIEPALLDPQLKVGRGVADRQGRFMSYWPSYSAIHPDSRTAYLEWLAGGRGPGAYVGYVFLFFYGIERRVLADAAQSRQARSEVDVLLAEVERLKTLYKAEPSFQGYAANLLSFARYAYRPVQVEELRPPLERVNFAETPLTVRLALGSFAQAGRPIPAEWALSWLLTSPDIYLRTPAVRCPDEFRELFEQRYLETFDGMGLIVPPGKLTITAHYYPASATFSGQITLKLDVPEVTAYPAFLRPIRDVADGVVQDLDAYSRWVGRTGGSDGLAALALLPAELALRRRDSEEAVRMVEWIERKLAAGSSALVNGRELFAHWPVKMAGKATRREAEMLAGFLAQRGYGMEPDVRFGGALFTFLPVVLFRLPDDFGNRAGNKAGNVSGDISEVSPAYHAAAVLLHLAAAVSAADGSITEPEERHLLAHLESSLLHLSDAERTRLKAHLRWLLAVPPGLAGLKKRIAPLPAEQRRGIGQFLIGVAGADGHIGSEELKLLTRIYALLGLDAQAVYSDIHALASGEEPVTVRPAEPATGFPIPKPKPRARPQGVTLDLQKVQAKLAETEQVSSFLEEIFREEEAPSPPVAVLPSPGDGRAGDGRGAGGEGAFALAGLDAAHSSLLQRLAEKDAWPRMEIERLADELGLLPDGALELINEAAFALCGAPLLEGDEMIEIDRQILQEITAT